MCVRNDFTGNICYIFYSHVIISFGMFSRVCEIAFLHDFFDIFSNLMYPRPLEFFSSLWIYFFYRNYLIYFQIQCTRAPRSFSQACKFAFFTTIISYIFNFNVPAPPGASFKPVNLLFLHNFFIIFSILMYLRHPKHL